MKKPVRPDPAAEAEIRAEVRWYEDERSGLGQLLLDEIQHAIDLISEYPAIGGVVPGIRGIDPKPRRIPVRRFPFHLIYREFVDEIELIALAPPLESPPETQATKLETLEAGVNWVIGQELGKELGKEGV